MEILDNVNSLFGDNLKKALGTPGAKLKIAASTFSIYAYEALKKELEGIESLEFIFTSPTFVPDEVTDKLRREHREFHIPKRERERSLYGTEFEIHLKNKLTQRAIAKECADWLRRKATFRSNRGKAPMQQFACVTSGVDEVAYMPLHGFTAVDLGYQQGNAVSNYVNRLNERPMSSMYLQLFDQIWRDGEKLEDVTASLCDHIDSVYRENSPERIYFLILYNIFNEFLEDLNEDVLPNDRTGYQESLVWKKLFNFQRDAATGIINKLETYNGCILADSVGLGKTFTALAVVKYYELRNKSVLVLCPKKLADNWTNYNKNLKTNIFSADRFNYDVLCHTDLGRERGESLGIPLGKVNWGNYDLVVIDESHNFRNNDAFKEHETRYQKLMRKVIQQGVKTKVLMLSATPVNNRFNDLRNQLALAYEGDPENLSKSLKTGKAIDEIFRRAQATFNTWSSLPPEERTTQAILRSLDFDFFELLDSVTIARSRKHIETFYDTSDIGTFPERLKPISHRAPLTHRTDVPGFNEIFTDLSRLLLAVYTPVKYILPSRLEKYHEFDTEVSSGGGTFMQLDREDSLRRLMTINLLKRLESSVEAFRLTLQRLQEHNQDLIRKIKDFREKGAAGRVADYSHTFEDAEPDDDDIPEPGDESLGGKVDINLADMDLESWERDLSGDLFIIKALLSEMRKIEPEHDAKLQHLKALVDGKIVHPINPGNKKVLVFTAFADTARYLYDQLAPHLLARHNLHSGLVTGSDHPKTTVGKGHDFQTLMTFFSPVSKDKALLFPDEPAEIDFLIGTDCISEGQNLQDCDYLVNYDIHWNPVRIIQRFGRIDRIGSRNSVIQLVNYWPDISLDEYIKLKERVENRMVIADVTATGDDNVLVSQNHEASYRREQLRRLQDEVLDLEDVKEGVSITDLGLNDFRMDLLNYVKANGDLAHLPHGMHAVVPADPEKQLHPGVIFALRNRNHGVNINQQNRLHPYYLVYLGDDGSVLVNHTEVKKLLDLVRSACKHRNEPIPEACRLFNAATGDGKNMAASSALLDAAINSMIAAKDEGDLDSLFRVGRTTALRDTISGLDDFELIAFVVVQDVARQA